MLFEVKALNKSFGGKPLLKNINFTAEQGEIISFVGPSGVGKTTLLRMIAGLEIPDSGTIVFKSITKPNRKNPAVMVFQDFLLFPNMTVFDNVAFGLRAEKMKKPLIHEKVMEMLECFQIEDKPHHYPSSLSAGQRQRVALARAMVINPLVLLLDEPFANLDKNLKADTAEFIHRTQKRFETTTIAVMHDQEEAFRMSDRIGVMLDGTLVQLDTVSRVFNEPISVKVASFLGQVNVVTPEAVPYLSESTHDTFKNLKRHRYYFRAEGATLTPDSQGKWRINAITFFGTHVSYRICNIFNTALQFTISSLDNRFQTGDRVNLTIHQMLNEPIDDKQI